MNKCTTIEQAAQEVRRLTDALNSLKTLEIDRLSIVEPEGKESDEDFEFTLEG